MKIIYKLILILIVLTNYNLVLAQDESGDEVDVYEISLAELMNIEVVTASQSAQKVTDAPATIHVVTYDQIKDRGYTNLEDLLEDIPEIEIQRKSVAEYSNYYSFRGIAGNEKFMILLNGIRINSMAGTPHVVGNNYSIANAKRVEIILGPASALYGVDAFSGIINIITRTGNEIDGIEGGISYGSFGTTDNSLVLGYGDEDISVSVTGSHYYSDEPNFAEEYPDDYSWFNNQYSLNGNMRLAPFAPNVIVPSGAVKKYETPTNAYFLNVGINIKDFEFGFTRNYESHNSSVGMKPDYNIYTRDAQYNVLIQSFNARHNYSSKNEKWGIQSNLSRGSYELAPDSKFINTFTGYVSGYKYAYHNSFLLREQITFKASDQTSIIGGFSFQDVDALAKTGDLPFKYDKNSPEALQNIYYIGTNTTDLNGNDLTLYQDFYHVKQNNIGSFIQLQNKFSDFANLTAGLRYDYNTRYGSSVNPRLGLVISPSEFLKFKILYGKAFLAPSVYKAFQHYGAFIPVDANGDASFDPNQTTGLFGPFWHLTNPNLKPETLNTFEFGSSYIKGNIGLSFDGYYNIISNLIVPELEFNQKFKNIDVAAVERAINKGEANTYGFTVKLDSYNEIGSFKIQSYVAYSYSDGDVDGAPLPFSAQSTVKAGVMAKAGKFSFNPRLVFRTASLHPTIKDADGNPASNDSFSLVNLFTKYSINDNVSFNLKIRNLLDQRYYNVSLAQDEGFAATPQDPIKIMLGVNLKF